MNTSEGKSIYWEIEGHQIEIKYPNKLYWPKNNITKLELVSYYKSIADIMMPYLANRPVTLHYFPRGIEKISFYKRDFSQPIDGLIDTFDYHEISQDKIINVPIIENTAGIIYLASKGCIEFHTWASKIPDYQYPDWAIFDLDISENTTFSKVLEAALLLHNHLNEIGVQGFAKTTGGSGIHVYVPIKNKYSYKQVKNWVVDISDKLSEKYPNLIANAKKERKTHSGDKVVIDYLQNVITRNTACIYTARAHDFATVSTPVTWEEVEKGNIRPTDFTIKTVPKRIAEKGDLFKELLLLKQEIDI